MAETPSQLMGSEHLATIDEALNRAKDIRKEVELAKRAGITDFGNGKTLSQYEDQLNTAENQLRQIKQVYFPGQ